MPEQFWQLTMREFRLMQMGYLKKLEDEQIHHWDLARTLGSFILQPHLKKGKSMKPSDIIPLPIDAKRKAVESLKNRRLEAQFAMKKRELIKKKNRENPQSRENDLLKDRRI